MWAGIKYALNSTLGNPNFLPLDKILKDYIRQADKKTLISLGKIPSQYISIFPDDEVCYENAIISHSFQENYHIKGVVIWEGVTSIETGAFLHCESLESVVIPRSVDIISDQAFAFCPELQFIDYQGTKEEFSAKYIADNWLDGSTAVRIYCIDGEYIQ